MSLVVSEGQFQRLGTVVDTLPCENKHQMLKTIVENDMKSLRSFENLLTARFVLADIEKQKDEPKNWWTARVLRETKRGPLVAKMPWLTIRPKQPLVQLLPDAKKCFVVHQVEERGQEIWLRAQVFCLQNIVADGIYEWSATSNEQDLQVLMNSKTSWYACTYWKQHQSSLLTIW